MASTRPHKSLVGRRRRADDEGEDDEVADIVQDSGSEASVSSDFDGDEDEDIDDFDDNHNDTADEGARSSLGQDGAVQDGSANGVKRGRKSRKRSKKPSKDAVEASAPQSSEFKATTDTNAMMNGLTINDDDSKPGETLHFDEIEPTKSEPQATEVPETATKTEPLRGDAAIVAAARPRRDYDDYRKRRDADPSFIPTRGNFFMHDTRSANIRGGPVMRGGWNNRGQGRGGMANESSRFGTQMTSFGKETESVWKHDLHGTINEEPPSSTNFRSKPTETAAVTSVPPKTHQSSTTAVPPQARASATFSSTTLVGKVQIRVFLPLMKAPIVFSEVPWKQYTRLPDHRPPLRRDKPVRISLPEHVQRYIFPSVDRSFIFIPRQMRPSQQGFGRSSGYQRSISGYGYSSRRTSMYGGSVYAGSVAASRRSSFGSVARENAFSPVGSYTGFPPTRPVVRLPHGSQSNFSLSSTPMGPLSGHQTPNMQIHTYPLPQQPAFQGTPTTTMHQPRPQKTISVTDIESPAAALQQPTPAPQGTQPFQNQLPTHMGEHGSYPNSQGSYYGPRQPPFYAQHHSQGSSLSGIPEQAIHAPSFQPPQMNYSQPAYYPSYASQQYYTYGPPSNGYVPMPMYAPPPQQGYIASPPESIMPSQPDNTSTTMSQTQDRVDAAPQSQSGMVAHESNGMVYYMPAAEAQQQSQAENYQPAESFVPSYAMPGLPPPTPAPDASYYYPSMQMPMANVHDPNASMYYPAQGAAR